MHPFWSPNLGPIIKAQKVVNVGDRSFEVDQKWSLKTK
uniref:Uncharacterized protein n=1 Tax=Anguilla anguilla TaxID=7936 RepID=A0A0E9SVX1_ANGAN